MFPSWGACMDPLFGGPLMIDDSETPTSRSPHESESSTELNTAILWIGTLSRIDFTMPTFLLCMRAELENIESVSIPSNASYTLTVGRGAEWLCAATMTNRKQLNARCMSSGTAGAAPRNASNATALLLKPPQVKNSSGDDIREGVVVSPLEEHEISGSRGTAHFKVKWARDASKEATLSIEFIKGVTRAYTAQDEGKFVPVVAFECRGLDPIAWEPQDEFMVKAPSGTTWEEVDLSGGDWAEYDEKSSESVSIQGLEWKFETFRQKK